MHCKFCGSSIADDASFCDSCGKDLRDRPVNNAPAYNSGAYAPQKSTGVGILLNLLLPGVGHIYAGKFVEGIVIFIVAVIVLAAGVLLLFPIILYLAIWVWAMYDVNNKIKEYNEYIRNNGNPPW